MPGARSMRSMGGKARRLHTASSFGAITGSEESGLAIRFNKHDSIKHPARNPMRRLPQLCLGSLLAFKSLRQMNEFLARSGEPVGWS
jgi:hypothetical protein